MPGLHVYISNRLEILKDHLFQIVAEPLRSPLESEIIVVQSKGMERWLTHQLAQKAGIWANTRFPFPNAMIQDLFQSVSQAATDDRYFSPDFLTWRILHRLGSCLDRPGFETLKEYLGSDEGDLKLVQLAARIADLFDQYSVYRPEMLLAWQQGRDERWQAQLWRELSEVPAGGHRAAMRKVFLQQTSAGLIDAGSLPARLSIFGISTLPPFHLEVFAAVARDLPVHLFFMNPSREYWGEIASPRRIATVRSRRSSSEDVGDDYFESGNHLLASWGKMGRDFLAMIMDQEGYQETTAFEDPGEETLLRCLQSDILLLRDRGHDGVKTPLSPEEGSLRIHSCHSPLREIEVLHDCILELLERHAGLVPNEILVMTPSVEVYAPFIAAVFGGAQNSTRIPFSIVDRSASIESPTIQCFLKILSLKGSRLGADEVMDLLESPDVQRRFEFQPGDTTTIRYWIERVHIRWGIDAEDRESRGLPRFEENSWKAGLERLLLGYALPEEDDKMFDDILPFGDVEGSTTKLLGRFAEFVRLLSTMLEDMAQPKTLRRWSESLRTLLLRFIKPDEESESDFQLIMQHLQQLEQFQLLGGVDMPIALEAVRYFLLRRLGQEESSRTFLSHGITFCAMLPMRSVPAKVVALLGMNGTTFPRTNTPLPFDLMKQSPQKGDRSLRDEDKYLFLESLLSARDHLHISYVGQSVKDNSPIPPSVLVSELVDAIDHGFELRSGGSVSEEIVINHALQAFSDVYFLGDKRMFSFSRENFEALQALRQQNMSIRPFVSASIGEPGAEWKQIDLEALKRFFRNAARFFCQERLRVNLRERFAAVENREPFEFDALDTYDLKQELLRKQLSGKDLWSLYPAARKRGVLPLGKNGELAFESAASDAEALARKLKPLMQGSELQPLEVDLELRGFRLSGRLKSFWPHHLVHYRCATIKPQDRLALWIDHLVLNYNPQSGYPMRSILVGSDQDWALPPVTNAESHLEKLLDYFWKGLSQPLPFFSETSFEYANQIFRGHNPDDAVAAARKKWIRRDFNGKPGESEDPYYEVAFGERKIFDGQFTSVAWEIFGPILKLQEKV